MDSPEIGKNMVDNPLPSTGRESKIYTSRFSEAESELRSQTWKVFCRDYLQQFIKEDSILADVGSGDGYFLRYINAKKKIAVDLGDHVEVLKKEGITILRISATELPDALDEKLDVIFMSNFLEHMPTKMILLDVLDAARKSLKPDGRLIILQPNIRYVGPSYWDYIDHHIALTEQSLVEALQICGFKIEKLVPRLLPYTVKSTVGQLIPGACSGKIVEWYLRFPFLWRLFGKQTFVVASPA